jgi:hypothetical protein
MRQNRFVHDNDNPTSDKRTAFFKDTAYLCLNNLCLLELLSQHCCFKLIFLLYLEYVGAESLV